MNSARILVVDDETNMRRTLRMTLEADGHEVSEAASGEEALGRIARGGIDLVLLDVLMPGGMDGIEVLERLREQEPELPVVVMSGQGTIETAVRATRLGALDFLEKPLSSERVGVAVDNALTRGRLERENRELRQQIAEETELIGDSPIMRELRDFLAKIAPTDGRVLILGESGTGKELVARAIHAGSPRARQPFVVLNCAAVPGELIESELFGHEKGAFTGALSRRAGRFELAHRGTLLLDEIGDMPLVMQPKLLRVLEDGKVERVGGAGKEIQVDVRVVAATNQELEARVAAGEFRADLFHRLNVVPIHLRPLRDRREDIAGLALHFLELTRRRHGRAALAFDVGALDLLATYRWPGNARELRNAVERLVILADAPAISATQVRALVPQLADAPAPAGSTLDMREAVRGFERSHIRRVLEQASGVMAEAARLLNLERSYLYKKMRDLGIDRGKE